MSLPFDVAIRGRSARLLPVGRFRRVDRSNPRFAGAGARRRLVLEEPVDRGGHRLLARQVETGQAARYSVAFSCQISIQFIIPYISTASISSATSLSVNSTAVVANLFECPR